MGFVVLQKRPSRPLWNKILQLLALGNAVLQLRKHLLLFSDFTGTKKETVHVSKLRRGDEESGLVKSWTP